MSQAALQVLAFKFDLFAEIASIALWILVWTHLAPWWKNPVSRSMVIVAALIGLSCIPAFLSLFFHLNRLDSLVTGWFDVSVLALIAAAMFHRSIVWLRLHYRTPDETEILQETNGNLSASTDALKALTETLSQITGKEKV